MKLYSKLVIPALARQTLSYEIIESGDVFSCTDGLVHVILCIVRDNSKIATIRTLCNDKVLDIPEGIFSLKIKDKLVDMCKLAN